MRRKRFREEQIIALLKEADQPGVTAPQVCRAHGASENTFYRWKKKSAGMGVADAKRLRELEKENARLKTLIANRDLEIDAIKELLRKNS
jgi:putative transposase